MCVFELPIHYINSGCLCMRLSDTTILHFNSPAEPASAFSMAEPVAVMTRRVAAFSMAESVFRGRAAVTDRAGRQGQGRPGQAKRPGKYKDMVFRTWDLNFGAWIFTLAISKTET